MAEVRQLRRLGVQRFFLPSLPFEKIARFFAEFDQFWDEVVAPFDKSHVFWRNGISSKMQEWESSAGYLALVLFTLKDAAQSAAMPPLWILTESLEEEDLIKAWAKKEGWIVTEPLRLPRWIRRVGQESKNFLRYLHLVAVAFQRKFHSGESKNSLSSLSDKTGVLLVSMFYPSSIKDGEYKDPFFGDLAEFLSTQSKHCMTLADSISLPAGNTKKGVLECQSAVLKMPLALLSFYECAALLTRLLARRIKFPQKTCFLGCDFSKLLSWQARSFKFHFNWHAQVYYEAVKTLIRRYPLKELIFIFEGNVFERACIQAAQDSSGIWTCGYSQGVIYPANLKLRITGLERTRRPEADRIVCTGPEARSFLSRAANRALDRMTSGCTLRAMPLFSSNRNPDSKTILVALDGVYNTVSVLDWLLEHEDLLKNYHVRLRGHPNVPLKEIQKQCLRAFPSHFTISERSLQEDIEESHCVLYRHTSIGLQALAQARPVIHLSIDSPLPGDPLEDISLGKWTVHSGEELKGALQEINNLSSQERVSLKNARSLLEGYFAPPEKEAMGNFLFSKDAVYV